MALFEKSREKTGGRASGTRNKFSKKFDDALLRDLDQHGAEAIKIAAGSYVVADGAGARSLAP
jgi:hypothetical protein